MENLYITNELREKLKQGFGELISGTEKEVNQKFKQYLKENNYNKIITIGDFCSGMLASDIKIFDGRINRNEKMPLQKFSLSCYNPPASINKDSWNVIKKSINQRKNIRVKGEEDLLVVPAVLLAEEEDLVIYGFPKKGIYITKVETSIKSKFRNLLKDFKKGKFEKIICGGTFDPFSPKGKSAPLEKNSLDLHSGHKYFLTMAKYYAKEVVIGLTSDKMARETQKRDNIRAFEQRKEVVEKFLQNQGIDFRISKLEDIYGPGIKEENAEAILLTEETFQNGVEINKKRKKEGLKELTYIILPYIMENGDKISSSRLKG